MRVNKMRIIFIYIYIYIEYLIISNLMTHRIGNSKASPFPKRRIISWRHPLGSGEVGREFIYIYIYGTAIRVTWWRAIIESNHLIRLEVKVIEKQTFL